MATAERNSTRVSTSSIEGNEGERSHAHFLVRSWASRNWRRQAWALGQVDLEQELLHFRNRARLVLIRSGENTTIQALKIRKRDQCQLRTSIVLLPICFLSPGANSDLFPAERAILLKVSGRQFHQILGISRRRTPSQSPCP